MAWDFDPRTIRARKQDPEEQAAVPETDLQVLEEHSIEHTALVSGNRASVVEQDGELWADKRASVIEVGGEGSRHLEPDSTSLLRIILPLLQQVGQPGGEGRGGK